MELLWPVKDGTTERRASENAKIESKGTQNYHSRIVETHTRVRSQWPLRTSEERKSELIKILGRVLFRSAHESVFVQLSAVEDKVIHRRFVVYAIFDVVVGVVVVFSNRATAQSLSESAPNLLAAKKRNSQRYSMCKRVR